MDKKYIILISITLLTFLTALAGLFSSAFLIKQMTRLEAKVDYLYAQNPDAPIENAENPAGGTRLASHILARSADNTFAIYGYGECAGEYRVGAPVESTLFGGKSYDLYHPITLEDSDLGAVAIQTPAQYQANPAYPSIAFRTDTQVVSYTLIENQDEDCSVGIGQP
ncbi:hypothetical protein M0Q28_03245 [Patescibacteria group bacterium]|jgi:hypothetical protein|nr:hypothetical protein [Patescibacteria group bacterium]